MHGGRHQSSPSDIFIISSGEPAATREGQIRVRQLFLMLEKCNTLVQLVTSTSSYRTNGSISPKVTFNDKN